MRIGAAAFGLAAAILVSGASIHWSSLANGEACEQRHENLSIPSLPPLSSSDLPSDRLAHFLHDHPGACTPELSSDQIANALTGGVLIGFIAYAFGLLFGKFIRWASR